MSYKSYLTIFTIKIANLFSERSSLIHFADRRSESTPLKNRLRRRWKSSVAAIDFSSSREIEVLFSPFNGETDPVPLPPRRRSAFSSWCLRGYCVALVSSCINVRASSVQIPPSRIHPTVVGESPSQMPVSPAGSHCARWCAPGGASKRSRSRRTPSTTDGDYHLQSWVQCVRVCSGPESCCERPAWLGVRAKLGQCHPRSSPSSSLSALSAGTAWERRHPRDSPFPTEIIGLAGRPDTTWFPVGVMYISRGGGGSVAKSFATRLSSGK